MKVLLVLCAAAAAASAGSISWPGATVVTSTPTVVNTIGPGQRKAFGFSTTQFIGPTPTGLPLAYQPQFSYQVPQFSAIPSLHHTIIPFPGVSYYPSTVFYPSHPGFGPVLPGQPFSDVTITPAEPVYPVQTERPIHDQPSQPAGDADTTVIDSADFPQQNNEDKKEQAPSTEAPKPDRPSAPQYPPASTFPNFPQIPQGFQDTPSFPQFPQEGGLIPSFPSLPQYPEQGVQAPSFPGFPQFPQISLPSFPQFPQQPSNPNYPQSPSPSPPSFTGDTSGGDKGLNDEDTISVESA